MACSASKEQLIDMLYFPHQLIQEELLDVAGECSHELRFSREDTRCLTCDFEDECQWLSENDEFSPLHLRSIPMLVRALDVAISYVQGDAIAWGHADYCTCQVCEWLKKAQKMYDAMELSEDMTGDLPGSHKSKIVRKPDFKSTPVQTNNFWRLQSVKNSITRLTNVRLYLLRSFQPK